MMSIGERLRLLDAITCTVCKEPCSKAVSLKCCGSASCRRCALAKLKEDNTKCWACGKLSGDVNTPSQMLNNDLIRTGVAFFNKNQSLCRVSATFEIFALLSNTERSEISELGACSTNDESQTLNYHFFHGSTMDEEEDNKRNKTDVELYVEPDDQSFSQFGVRDIFTGTGDTKLNKKLSEGNRKFNGTSVQSFRGGPQQRGQAFEGTAVGAWPWSRGNEHEGSRQKRSDRMGKVQRKNKKRN